MAAALVAAATGALGLGVAVAPPAAAHEEAPGVRTTFDGATPPLPDGIKVSVVVSAADQLLLDDAGQHVVEVLAETGEAFLRIGPAGVEANTRSPSFYTTSVPDGSASIPPDAKVGAEPRWAKVAADPVWGWFDHRLHPAAIGVPPDARPGQVIRLDEWSLDVRVDGATHALRGHREYVRPAGVLQSSIVGRDGLPTQVAVTVIQGRVPAVFLDATEATDALGGGDVTVVGAGGEPLARFSRRGVEVNEASPTWGLTAAANHRPVPGEIGITVAPRWVLQSDQPRLGWLEPRARYAEEAPPADVQARPKPTTLVDWRVPVEVGATSGAVRGRTTWVPAGAATAAGADGGGGRWRAVLIGVAGLAIAGGLLARLVLVRRAH